jgi:hypothetical protein
MFRRFLVFGVCVCGALATLSGCSTTMTPQQQAGVELRRFCEANPQDVVRCLGFLGDN